MDDSVVLLVAPVGGRKLIENERLSDLGEGQERCSVYNKRSGTHQVRES